METTASESMDVSDAEKERLFQQEYQVVIESISLDAKTFTHPVSAYQTLAGQGNEDAERMLNLVHTTASMQRVKDAITVMPSTAGSDFELAEDLFGDDGEDDEDDSMSIGGDADIPSWMLSKDCSYSHLQSTLFKIIHNTQITIQTSTNASTKRLLKVHLESLQLHKIQALQQSQNVDAIKQEIYEVKQDFVARLDARLPGTTKIEIAQKLRKEADLNRKVEAMESRLSNVKKSVAKILENQEAQTSLLQQLVAAQLFTSTQLDANKKREKDSIISVSQEEPTSEGENVLNIQVNQKFDVAALEKELDDKWKKIDEEIVKKFGPIEMKDKVFSHFSQLRQISANEMSLGNLEKGQTSCIKSPKANMAFKPKRSYPKSFDINPLDLMFETPRPDEKKLLARSIAFFKDPTDSVLKRRIAKIYRNGKEICVVAGHPQFAEAKKEEKERIKQEKKQAALDAKKLKQNKKQAAIVAKLQALKSATEISEKQTVVAEDQDQKMHKEPQQKRKFRYKILPKRRLDFNDDKMEDYTPNQSTSPTQTSKPSVVQEESKVDPTRNFHGELIVPKDEPVDWDSLPLPELNLPIFNKLKKTKTRAIKKVKPVSLKTKTLTKAQPTVNKGDLLYICDIKEFPYINLYMDELEEGKNMEPDLKEKIISLVRQYHDIFVWGPEDMSGLDSKTAKHCLNVKPEAKPVRQKKRTFASER
ncbi:hypothetical protein AgCh_020031 [Apium graveolens]